MLDNRLSSHEITSGVTFTKGTHHTGLLFDRPRPALSSAVFGGGMTSIWGAVILNVLENFMGGQTDFAPPSVTLAEFCKTLVPEKQAAGMIGMMTSAHPTAYEIKTHQKGPVELTLLITAGVSNARCAGDRADYRRFDSDEHPGNGTINTILVTNAHLTPPAFTEAIMIATEAKAAALQRLGIISPISGLTATGTGTDATAVIGGYMPPKIDYCGKHVLFGEMIGKLVIDGLTAILQK